MSKKICKNLIVNFEEVISNNKSYFCSSNMDFMIDKFIAEFRRSVIAVINSESTSKTCFSFLTLLDRYFEVIKSSVRNYSDDASYVQYVTLRYNEVEDKLGNYKLPKSINYVLSVGVKSVFPSYVISRKNNCKLLIHDGITKYDLSDIGLIFSLDSEVNFDEIVLFHSIKDKPFYGCMFDYGLSEDNVIACESVGTSVRYSI